MAEAIGVVGSAVRIASFAIQISDKIVQIKAFIDSVRLAPAEIKCLFEEISLATGP